MKLANHGRTARARPRRRDRRRGGSISRPVLARSAVDLRAMGRASGVACADDADRTARRGRAARAGAPSPAGVRHRHQLRRPRRRGRPGHPRVPAHVHEVPHLPHRAVRHGRAAQRVRRLGGGARARRRPARLRGGRGRRLVAHRRRDRRPGPLRANRANSTAGAAVQPRQVVPRLRPHRAVGGHPRRARRPRRPRAGVHRERRGSPEEPNVGPHLRRRRLDPPPVVGDTVAARRPHLHGHTRRRRRHPYSATVPFPRRRARLDDRRDRNDPHRFIAKEHTA